MSRIGNWFKAYIDALPITIGLGTYAPKHVQIQNGH